MSKLNEVRTQQPVSPAERKPPTVVMGTHVHAVLESKDLINGQVWLTLVPDDEKDRSLFEFSLTTGKIVRTRKAGAR